MVFNNHHLIDYLIVQRFYSPTVCDEAFRMYYKKFFSNLHNNIMSTVLHGHAR